jgi:hypothetical protein
VDRSTFSKDIFGRIQISINKSLMYFVDIGISTCLTPGIIAYLTCRGGILVGRELLALQVNYGTRRERWKGRKARGER